MNVSVREHPALNNNFFDLANPTIITTLSLPS
jgi:hypothetical protein